MPSQVTDMLQVMTTESRDSKVIMVMAMAREMLSQVMDMVLLLTIHMEVTVLSTEALRVSLEAMVVMVMVMARDLPNQDTMAVVTLTSTSPVPTIMVTMVMTFTTLTTQDMARGQLNLDTMDTAMVMLKAINMSPDITQTMALKFTILTKYSRLSERDCTFNNVSRYTLAALVNMIAENYLENQTLVR